MLKNSVFFMGLIAQLVWAPVLCADGERWTLEDLNRLLLRRGGPKADYRYELANVVKILNVKRYSIFLLICRL